jgi:hypothetical protein
MIKVGMRSLATYVKAQGVTYPVFCNPGRNAVEVPGHSWDIQQES